MSHCNVSGRVKHDGYDLFEPQAVIAIFTPSFGACNKLVVASPLSLLSSSVCKNPESAPATAYSYSLGLKTCSIAASNPEGNVVHALLPLLEVESLVCVGVLNFF